LREKLNPKVASVSPAEEHRRGDLKPNLDRLTVGVDLGDQWSNYCILDLEGETLAEENCGPRSKILPNCSSA